MGGFRKAFIDPGRLTIPSEQCWRAIFHRDARFDGLLVYGVRSTGIYCRPSCPARRPSKDQVVLFSSPKAAESSGFRPCRRCHPEEGENREPPKAWIEKLCRDLENEDFPERAMTFQAIASKIGVRPDHLSRSFKDHIGISPRQYREACRQERFRHLTRKHRSVTRALYEAGFGSSSRLYEKGCARFGMTPGTYQRGAEGLRIHYSIVDCFLGRLLVAATEKGICRVSLDEDDKNLERRLFQEFPAAEIHRGGTWLDGWIRSILAHLEGKKPRLDLPLDIQATAFQWRVFEALRSIPYGETRCYEEIARAVGKPKALRAVGRACASNPAPLIIPCHRVIRKRGDPGGYRWGVERKKALLAREKKEKAKTRKAGKL